MIFLHEEKDNLLKSLLIIYVDPTQVVLLGDDKQLRPIIKNKRAGNLGMSRSLFERYCTMHSDWVIMLDTQYRMVSNQCISVRI